MKKSAWTAVVGLLALGGVLGACSSDDDGGGMGGMDHPSEETSTVSESAAFNNADVTFAQSMIVHHEQAIEMAVLADDRAESDAVKDLASRIEGAQGPEIERMEGWLSKWKQPAAAEGGHEGMGGMMSEGDMSDLEEATGEEFDRMFLEMMIEHHQGAIEMSKTEVEDGESGEATKLANEIIEAQEAEIAEMEKLLEA